MSAELARTPLYRRHIEAGARMAAFAGFEMPVVYSSIVEEHRAVRAQAGLFDVSHMGEIRLRGRDALPFAQRLFTNDAAGTSLGRVRYGLFCLENGGVVDDVTLYRADEQEILFCVNAANIRADLDWMYEVQRREEFHCDIIDESEQTALLAIQGPLALDLVARLLPSDAKCPDPWRFVEALIAGVPSFLSRTGYTGEDGYEIYTPADRAVELWDALLHSGSPSLRLAGLGARDTLRTEMGYPLYGHELDREHNPIEAGLERFLAFGRSFCGEPALEADRVHGPARQRVGLVLEGRQVARTGYPILTDLGEGVVTSGTFGPSVERSIAMGYVPARCSNVGSRLQVAVRGRQLPCTVVETPFYDRKG